MKEEIATIATLSDGERWIHNHRALWQSPVVLLLSGPMGAGKTQVTRWILKDLGVEDVASPTFAIHHRYESQLGSVDHFDLFRLNSDADLESSGFWDCLEDPSRWMIVEWADRLEWQNRVQSRSLLFFEIEISKDDARIYRLKNKF